jgi:hypothetical protein
MGGHPFEFVDRGIGVLHASGAKRDVLGGQCSRPLEAEAGHGGASLQAFVSHAIHGWCLAGQMLYRGSRATLRRSEFARQSPLKVRNIAN